MQPSYCGSLQSVAFLLVAFGANEKYTDGFRYKPVTDIQTMTLGATLTSRMPYRYTVPS